VNRTAYYERLKALARAERAKHRLTTRRVMLSDLRAIYRAYGITIDLWPGKLRDLRGAYFSDGCGTSVMIAKRLPPEQRIFTMAHELKHHLTDHAIGASYCDPSNASEPIEIGAEIFAAEFIFPEQDFADALTEMGVAHGRCDAEAIVRLKDRTRTTLSYTSLAKRAEWLGFAPTGSLRTVRWKILAEELLGEPVYKRILRRRRLTRR
jgi:Zn-dependent peptidase ImmA (M78 family)